MIFRIIRKETLAWDNLDDFKSHDAGYKEGFSIF